MLALASPFADCPRNLALEEILHREVGPGHPGWLLFWRDDPCVVLGRFQDARAEVDPEALERSGAVLARRVTGGGAVYHDQGVLNVSLMTPAGTHDDLMGATARAAARVIERLGAPARRTGRNDVTVEDRKVCGLAATTGAARRLCHGSILVDCDLSLLGRILRPDPGKYAIKGLASVRSRVANLREFFPAGPDGEVLMRAIRDIWVDEAGAVWSDVPPEALRQAEALARAKYAAPDWTNGPTSAFTERRGARFAWGRVEAGFALRGDVVADCRIFGDFFAIEEISQVENALRGLRRGSPEMRRALRALPLSRHFLGCDPEEVVDCLGGPGPCERSPRQEF